MKKHLHRFWLALILCIAVGMTTLNPINAAEYTPDRAPETTQEPDSGYTFGRPMTEDEISYQRSFVPKLKILPENPDRIEHTANPDRAAYILFGDEWDGTDVQASIPSSYDLRSLGLVTPVHNQNPYGTCWTFGAMAALESNLVKNGIVKADSVDLSELHLAYFAYHQGSDALGNTKGDKVNYLDSDILYYLHNGGRAEMSALAFMNSKGVVNESTYPYYQNDTDMKAQTNKLAANVDNSWKYDAYTVDNIIFGEASDTQSVKAMLMTYGALDVDMFYDDYSVNYSYSTHYYTGSSNPNHEVTLVGWDDSFPKSRFTSSSGSKPAGDGAWIVKNSWGPYWGDDGYFYVSYYDTQFSKVDAVAYIGRKASSKENKYYYTGCVDWRYSIYVKQIAQAINVNANDGGKENVKSVGFYAGSDEINYSLQLYKNPKTSGGVVTNPASGTALLSKPITGYSTYGGYISIPLDQTITLSSGDVLTAVVTFDDYEYILYEPDYSHTLWSLVESIPSSEYGQTFYSTGGSFMDAKNNARTLRMNIVTTDVDNSIYTVKFNGNGSTSGSMSDKEYKINTTYTLPANKFVRKGYTFTGWNTKANGTGTTYANSASVSNITSAGSTVTLYAQWKENSYTLKLYGNGQTSGSTLQIPLKYTEQYTLPECHFKKTGYMFTGWNTKKDGSGTMYKPGKVVSKLYTTDGGAIALYAQWEVEPNINYTLKLYGNGATSGKTITVELKYSDEYALPTSPFTWPGYKFVGWNTKKDGTGTMYQPGDKVSRLTTKDGGAIALYAQWKEGKETSYTLKLYGNGAATGRTIVKELKYTEKYVLPANPFTWPCYEFTGWNTKIDGSGKMYQPGDTVSKLTAKDGGTTALYAQWKEGKETSYTLKLYGNGATTGKTIVKELKYTEEYILPANPFTWPCYEFIGWNTKKDGSGKMYQPGDTVSKLTAKDGAATALYAQWEVGQETSYTLKLYGNGATSGKTITVNLAYTEEYVLPASPFAWPGYRFVGWNKKKDGTGKMYQPGDKVSKLTATDGAATALYAQWRAVGESYNITYVLNGGTNSSQNPSFYVKGETTPLYEPTRAGYKFMGWFRSEVFLDVTEMTEIGPDFIGDLTLYANWKRSVVFLYDGNGATAGLVPANEAISTAGELATASVNGFERDGYIFKGWNTKADGSGITYEEGMMPEDLVEGDVEVVILYAQWEEIDNIN